MRGAGVAGRGGGAEGQTRGLRTAFGRRRGEGAAAADEATTPTTGGEDQPASAETPTTPEAADDAAAQPAAGDEAGGGRLVVFGDSDFVTNDQIGQAGNAALVNNTLNWLVERQSHLGIPPKEPEQVAPHAHTPAAQTLLLAGGGGMPGLALATGIFVYLRRRR